MIKKQINFVIIFLILVLSIQTTQANDPQQEEVINELFQQAKKLIHEKKWHDASTKLNMIIRDFPNNQWIDDSLFWLGYSLNKQSQQLERLEDKIKLKEKALKDLEKIILDYQTSKWVKNAQILSVEIAEELAQKGLQKYKKYIVKSAQEDENALIKLAALDALMFMDKEKAIPILTNTLKKTQDIKLKKRAIFVLSQHQDPQVIKILIDIASNDPALEIKEKAIFCLGQFQEKESREALIKIYYDITNLKLKEDVISAIAQSDGKDAIKALIKIYKTEKSLNIRKKIIFWIGQSNTSEAQDFILDILEK